MFSHDYFTIRSCKNKPFVHSQTSSELLQEVRVPDGDSKQFALCQFSSSKEKVKIPNVECAINEIEDCDLEYIRQRYRIPNSVKMFAPKMGQTVDNPPKDCFAVYIMMLENGLRLPVNDFVNEILAAVGRAPAQITYNSWAILTAFQVACHVAGVKTSIELFENMYKNVNLKKGNTYFSPKDNKNLTLLNLPNKRKWDFFFVSANAFGEKVPRHFCVNFVNFKFNRLDTEFQFLEFSKKFPRRLLYNAYLDEKVLLMCNIYKDTNKGLKEDAYDLLLKVNDALVQNAIAKNNQCILKLIEDENLRSGILAAVEASDVPGAFKLPVASSSVAPSPKFPVASSTAKISRRPFEATSDAASENLPIATSVVLSANPQSDGSAARFPVVSSGSVKTEKVSILDPSPKLAVANSSAKISRRPFEVTSDGSSENMPIATSVVLSANPQSDGSAARFPVVSSSSVKTEKVSTLDPSPKLAVPISTAKISRRTFEVTSDGVNENMPIATSLILSANPQGDGFAARFPVVSSSSVKTENVSTLDADVEIIDLDILFSKKNSSSKITHTVCSTLPTSDWLQILEGKRQADTIHKSIAHPLKKKRINNEHSILDGEELATWPFQFPLLPEEIVVGVEEENMETDQMPIKEQTTELVKEFTSEVSDLKDQDELDSISVQLDAILKKGTQSLQVTSDHRIQLSTVLASLGYCHLGSSLEKFARQVSNLREQVQLLHSRHAKLERCLESYNQQVSNCKNNIVVLNLVRARLETFGLKESPQEVSRLEIQVEQLNSILVQLDTSVAWSAQLKTSLEKSEQQVSATEDQVERLIEQNRRFDIASLEKFSQDSQLQLKSLRTEFETSLKEFNQLEESLNKSAQNVRDLINQVGQLTSFLALLLVDVEQANNDFKVSSDSTKILYQKAR